MKIPKSILISPGRNTAYGICALTISFFAFAYSYIYGQTIILAFYAVWLLVALVDYRFALFRLVHSPVVLTFALFACLSIFWSAAPGDTARASVQYLSHVVCAVIAARVIDGRTFSIGAMVGTTLVLLYSVLAPNYVYDPLDGSYTFVGAFTSKNQLGFFASLGVFFSFYYAVFMTRSMLYRAVAFALFCFSASVLLMSQSATSLIATPAAMAAVLMISGLGAFSPRHRKLFLWIGILLAVGAAVMALNMGLMDIVLGAFGKDSTLTGRTYLWPEGLKAAHEAPILGQGYQAYWVQGFADAERLWNEFYIAQRTGFHFHNTYIESLVELGYVGTALIVFLFLSTIYACVKKLVNETQRSDALLLAGVMILLVVRSFFEVDVLFPYTIGSFLLYYCWARAREAAPRRQPVTRQHFGADLVDGMAARHA